MGLKTTSVASIINVPPGRETRRRGAKDPQDQDHSIVQERAKSRESVLGFDQRREREALESERTGAHANEEAHVDRP